MSDALATYLHDHLAGAAYAVDLLENIRDQHKDHALGRFAANLLVDIEADRQTLRKLAESVGAESNAVKEATAWLGEKISRLKLRQGSGDDLGTLEALELLQSGIHGKLALWHALAAIAPQDQRLRATDFAELAARAEHQMSAVEENRIRVAISALRLKPA